MFAWSAAAVGAFLFTAGVISIRKNKLPRARNWLMLLAGTGMSGILGAVIGWLTGTLGKVGGTATQIVFGVGVPAVIGFAVAWILAIDLHPKKGKPSRVTPWLALLAFPLLVVTFGGVMGSLPDRVNEAVASAGSALSQAIGDLINNL
ncbi:hypothetical protein SAMN05421678_106265 [Actinopolymorpha cephalotaxi]|uniref:Gas vesicle protein n=1 Tax=Actinopolymorpha cephalotaxi TaxID=504797 RepID=A0A1I2SL30_9ACTN|nr:hypothetical protein [Actinopolymorpha cephalotaxi]NYH84014.1 gas vesicle protein [Actinopolymorpha cephalotaxi]SFG53420.1 hypothetical protein SAMN05421678_106265 [Actinopolymorpha cephalotaxi]